MKLEITVIGWVIIFVFYAVAAAVIALLFRRSKKTLRTILLVAVVPVIVVAPLADEAWIGWHFREACKDAGVHVIRAVQVDGYLDATSPVLSSRVVATGPVSDTNRVFDFEKAGYRFHENLLSDGRVSHWEREAGEMIVAVRDRPEARYHYQRIVDKRDGQGVHYELPIALKVERGGEMVVDGQTGEIIGTNVIYKRRPGWIDGLWMGKVGTAVTVCPNFESSPPQPPFPRAVLIPSTKR
jgi:hypothetical protein